MKLYKELALTFSALDESWKKGDEKKAEEHREYLRSLIEKYMGIDDRTELYLNFARSQVGERLTFNCSRLLINPSGFRYGWFDFKAMAEPDLRYDFQVRVKGMFSVLPQYCKGLDSYLSNIIKRRLNQELYGGTRDETDTITGTQRGVASGRTRRNEAGGIPAELVRLVRS